MINIIIPSCGKPVFWEGFDKPRTQYEVEGRPMVVKACDNYNSLDDKHVIFMFLEEECSKYHTDDVVSKYVDGDIDIIKLNAMTQGSLCSCLMAIDLIDNDSELIIANNDNVFVQSMDEIIGEFRKKEADCGVATFNSVDERWSFAKTAKDSDDIIETAERRAISNKAIAGLYYFKKGSEFVECAKNAIRKGCTYNNIYFISAAINEMILKNKKVKNVSLKDGSYYCFYEKKIVEEYEGR